MYLLVILVKLNKHLEALTSISQHDINQSRQSNFIPFSDKNDRNQSTRYSMPVHLQFFHYPPQVSLNILHHQLSQFLLAIIVQFPASCFPKISQFIPISFTDSLHDPFYSTIRILAGLNNNRYRKNQEAPSKIIPEYLYSFFEYPP